MEPNRPETRESRPETSDSYVVGVEISPQTGDPEVSANITISKRDKQISHI